MLCSFFGHVFGMFRVPVGNESCSVGLDTDDSEYVATVSTLRASASPRVDVDVAIETASVSPLWFLGRSDKRIRTVSRFSQGVDGKTLVSELRADIARRVHASPGHCYVTRGGKLLSLSSTLEAAQVVKGSCVELHARGVGGSVPGEWFCNHCNSGGGWPARQRCFRRGMARSESEPLGSWWWQGRQGQRERRCTAKGNFLPREWAIQQQDKVTQNQCGGHHAVQHSA